MGVEQRGDPSVDEDHTAPSPWLSISSMLVALLAVSQHGPVPTMCLPHCCLFSLPCRQPCWPQAAAVGTMRGLWALTLVGFISACEGKELPAAEGKGHWGSELGVYMAAAPSLLVPGQGRAKLDPEITGQRCPGDTVSSALPPPCQDHTQGHASGQSSGCGHHLAAEFWPSWLWEHPVRAGGQGEPRKPRYGEPAWGHPHSSSAPTQAMLMEQEGLDLLRVLAASWQLRWHCPGAGWEQRLLCGRAGSAPGGAKDAPERILASVCEVRRGLAVVHISAGELGAAPMQLGPGGPCLSYGEGVSAEVSHGCGAVVWRSQQRAGRSSG